MLEDALYIVETPGECIFVCGGGWGVENLSNYIKVIAKILLASCFWPK
jgi:hypothetical protein